MTLSWKHENPANWTADMARIVGGAPSGAFAPELTHRAVGAAVPGDWWRVDRDGATVGYGWMDVVWGDGEVLLAVAPEARGGGVGAWIVEQLCREAADQGVRVVYNTVRATHPERAQVRAWLLKHGFEAHGESGEILRRKV